MCTPQTYFGDHPIISTEPAKTIKADSIISAFDSYTWLCLFTMETVFGVTLCVCRKYAKNPDGRANFCSCLWELGAILSWDGVVRIRHAPLPLLCIHTANISSTFVLVSMYFAEFTSIAVKPFYVTPPIKTLKQLDESEFKWVSGYDTDTKLFKKMFGQITSLRKRHVNFTSEKGDDLFLISLKKVKQNPHNLLTFLPQVIVNKYIEKYALEKDKQKFYLSKETFFYILQRLLL